MPRRRLRVPGVLAVLTGADFIADRINPIPNKTFSLHPAEMPLINTDGTPAFNVPDYPLPADKARFVGEAIAMVIAESIAAAKDGAERVIIDYEPLPCVTFTVDAAAPRCAAGARRECVQCLHRRPGRRGRADRSRVSRGRAYRQDQDLDSARRRLADGAARRDSAITIRPPAVTRSIPAAARRCGCGAICRSFSMCPEPNVRLVIRDVGGNFGTRGAIFAEQPLVAWAARRVGRPVKWTSERSEVLLSDYQGRDLAVEAELALDKDGNFLAMRGSNVGNLGSHTGNFSMVQKGVEIMSSIYRMPAASFRARAVLSHTAPTRPYRSSGRPEVIYVMERLIDIAARQAGFDRRRIAAAQSRVAVGAAVQKSVRHGL